MKPVTHRVAQRMKMAQAFWPGRPRSGREGRRTAAAKATLPTARMTLFSGLIRV
jgi:hypothetical protein